MVCSLARDIFLYLTRLEAPFRLMHKIFLKIFLLLAHFSLRFALSKHFTSNRWLRLRDVFDLQNEVVISILFNAVEKRTKVFQLVSAQCLAIGININIVLLNAGALFADKSYLRQAVDIVDATLPLFLKMIRNPGTLQIDSPVFLLTVVEPFANVAKIIVLRIQITVYIPSLLFFLRFVLSNSCPLLQKCRSQVFLLRVAFSLLQRYFCSALSMIAVKLILNIKLINIIDIISTTMPVKRRNHGRNKNNRGFVKTIVCVNCGRLCPKDKAIKRFTIRDIVDASSKKDLEENRAFETYIIPKLYIKMQYCIGCGIHSRIVKVRSNEDRKNRAPPQRVQRDAAGKVVNADKK